MSEKILRPADCRGMVPEPRVEMPKPQGPVLTDEFINEYLRTRTSEVRRRYEADPVYRALLDQYFERTGQVDAKDIKK